MIFVINSMMGCHLFVLFMFLISFDLMLMHLTKNLLGLPFGMAFGLHLWH